MENTLAQVFAKQDAPKPLTVEMLEEAIPQIPKHRTDLIGSARNTLALVKRGIHVKTNAPSWTQIQNVIFVSKIDGGPEGEGDNDD